MIRIDSNWVIEVDGACYIPKKYLQRTRTDKKTREEIPVYGSGLGFFTSLTSALEAVAKVRIGDRLSEGEVSLKRATEIIREERETMHRQLRELT